MRYLRRSTRLGLLMLPVVLPLALGCSPSPATASSTTDPQHSGRGNVVYEGEFQQRILLTGELQAVESESILVPRTPAWRVPIRWMEQDGAWVTEGQRVLELDNSQFTGDLAQKQLSMMRARNDLARKRADVEVQLSEKSFNLEQRRIELDKAKLKAGIPQEIRALRDYQEDQLALARAQSEFTKAEDDLATTKRMGQAELEELRIALRRTQEEIRTAEDAIGALTLNAPRDGILVVAQNRGESRKYQVGDNVWVGLAVMRIPELSKMKVIAQLSDVDDGSIHAGMLARCTLDIAPENTYSGQVTEITPVAQELGRQSVRRSFRAVILLDETDPEVMRPGMSVRAEILPRPRPDVLLIPRHALRFDEQDQPVAQLANGSTAEVQIGPCNATECVVEEGIRVGAKLRSMP